MTLEDGVDGLVPLEGVLGRNDVDDAVFAAVKGSVVAASSLDGLGEEVLKILLAGLAFLEAEAVVGVELAAGPVGALMGELERLVAVEVVDDLVIIGCIESLDCLGAVVVVAADEYEGVGSDGADTLDAVVGNAVPGVDVALVGDLIEQLENDVVGVAAVVTGELFPKTDKALLKSFAFEEALLILSEIEGEAGGLVQVENHLQTVGLAPAECAVDESEAFGLVGAVVVFQYIVVNGDTNMVESPRSDFCDVRFGDKAVEAFVAVIALREPAAEVDAFQKAFTSEHSNCPPFFLSDNSDNNVKLQLSCSRQGEYSIPKRKKIRVFKRFL